MARALALEDHARGSVAVDSRHAQMEQDRGEVLAEDPAQCLFTRARRDEARAESAEHVLHRHQARAIVVDDQDACLRGIAHFLRTAESGAEFLPKPCPTREKREGLVAKRSRPSRAPSTVSRGPQIRRYCSASSCASRSIVKAARMRRRHARLIHDSLSRSAASTASDSAIALPSRVGTRKPWMPSETTSGIAPTGVAITGMPAAIPSRSACGKPSL